MYIYIFFPYPNIGLSSLSLFYLAALSFFPCFFAFLYTTLSFFPVPTSYIQPCPIFSLFVCLPCPTLLFFFPRYRFLHKTLSFFFFIFFPCPMILLCLFSFRRRRIFQEKLSGDAKKKTYKRRALFPFSPELFFPFPMFFSHSVLFGCMDVQGVKSVCMFRLSLYVL